jgi:hypothetical protein
MVDGVGEAHPSKVPGRPVGPRSSAVGQRGRPGRIPPAPARPARTRPSAAQAAAVFPGSTRGRASTRANAVRAPAAARSAATAPTASPARGLALSAIQPMTGAPIGVDPRKTTE